MRSLRGCAMAERESKWGLLGACHVRAERGQARRGLVMVAAV